MATYEQFAMIPGLDLIESRIRQAEEQAGKEGKATEAALEQPQHALLSMAFALFSLVAAYSEAVHRIRSRVEKKPRTVHMIQLNEDEHRPLVFSLDAYLTAARRAQNTIWVYLSKILKVSVARSLAELVNKIERSQSNLPERLQKVILCYWEASGRRVKQYRDLSEHHAVVSSDSRVTLSPDGRELVYFLLANNPEVMKYAELRWHDPEIDALAFVFESFCAYHDFMTEIVAILTRYTSGPRTICATFHFKEPIRLGGPLANLKGSPVPRLEELIRTINERQKTVLARLERELSNEVIEPTLIVANDEKVSA